MCQTDLFVIFRMQLGLMYPVRTSKALGSLSQLKIIKQNSLTKVNPDAHPSKKRRKTIQKEKWKRILIFFSFFGHGESNFPCSVVQSETGPTG